MDSHQQNSQSCRTSRRQFFGHAGLALGSIAYTALSGGSAAAEVGADSADRLPGPLAPRAPHFKARAKNVIYLFMMGGPSQVDMYDYKPNLRMFSGDPIPPSYLEGVHFEQIREEKPKILGSPYRFERCGESGAWVSDLLPYGKKIIDELAFIRTIETEESVHPFAQHMLFTGLRIAGRPSLGSWVTYGLGSEADDLPGFVVLLRGGVPQAHDGIQSHGFLPSSYSGVQFRNQGAPILNLDDPKGVTRKDTARVLEAVRKLNRKRLDVTGDPEIASRIASYELAYKLQASAPGLLDLTGESQKTLDLYGVKGDKPSFGRDCLMARRLVERGVRFVQVALCDWDHHANIYENFPGMVSQMDQPCAALVQDLKQRGMLDDTLVVWGGEFGRTPVAQPQKKAKIGRDHHIKAFTMWMAGGGTRGGSSVGETDDLGMRPIERPLHIHDVQATILHALGLDHEKLTYEYQGRDFRLTDVYGNVIHEIFA